MNEKVHQLTGLGSLTQGIMRLSPRPVLIVSPTMPRAWGDTPTALISATP